MFFYSFQNKLSYLLSINVYNFNLYILLFFFILGIVTSLNPCFISILPIMIAYINSSQNIKKNNLIFILGLMTTLLFTSILINLFNTKYIHYLYNIPIVSSIILCIISLNMLQILKLSGFNIGLLKIFNLVPNVNNDYIYRYFSGFLIGLSNLPCSSSIIFIVFFWLSHTNNFLYTSLYFISYILGYIVSLLFLLNIAVQSINISIISSIWDIIIPLSSTCILFLSTFNIFEKILL
uniref:Thiol:disulfide interchange protein n=1 Tax=Pleonosporium borreri TaxID=2575635 RepID=A0A4D6WWJ9_9FLOR|nr:Thiol:disulfide interchange protein [Pleonosporium borreri]